MVSRIACLNLPEFPLQLLLRRHPEWSGHAVAVVDRDAAQGLILWSNERARESRILPGLRYASALSLLPSLRAGVVARPDIDAAIASLTGQLRFYTPDVEPSHDEPGVFWLGASGLSLLYPSLVRWAELIRDEATRAGFRAAVVVGFTRFGTCALAKTVAAAIANAGGAETGPGRAKHGPGGEATGPARAGQPCVLESPADERSGAARVPLARLSLDPAVRDTLERLGITTLGGFLALPANGVRTRFGEEAHRFHRAASGDLATPLQPAPPPEPLASSVHLDDPETSLERLLTVVERELRSLARSLDEHGRVLAAVATQLVFDDGTRTAERLQPASPTLDLAQIVELLRLRLASVLAAHANARGVTDLHLECEGAAAAHAQSELFAAKPPRDSAAAARAMARVRAELGDDAVVRAVLRDAHLPEARFAWERVDAVAPPKPRAVRTPPLVRRIHARALPFSPGRHRDAQAELIRHIDEGTVRETLGPYIVAGGWWTREVQREYYFVRIATGRVLWMYYDRRRMGWFIQGEVE
jgi:protein ImuB